MRTNQSGITMQYLQFWDTFNWSLYIRILEIKLDNSK